MVPCRAVYAYTPSGSDRTSGTGHPLGADVGTVACRLARSVGPEPGRAATVTGCIGIQGATSIMFNPRYELRP